MENLSGPIEFFENKSPGKELSPESHLKEHWTQLRKREWTSNKAENPRKYSINYLQVVFFFFLCVWKFYIDEWAAIEHAN